GVVVLVVRRGVVGELEPPQAVLGPALAEAAVVGVEQPELADVRDELGEEAPLERPRRADAGVPPGLLDRRPHLVPPPAARRVLEQEVLTLLELGRRQVLVQLAEREDPERHVTGLIGQHVAQQLVGALQYPTSGFRPSVLPFRPDRAGTE